MLMLLFLMWNHLFSGIVMHLQTLKLFSLRHSCNFELASLWGDLFPRLLEDTPRFPISPSVPEVLRKRWCHQISHSNSCGYLSQLHLLPPSHTPCHPHEQPHLRPQACEGVCSYSTTFHLGLLAINGEASKVWLQCSLQGIHFSMLLP